jgi:actin related protein 2/3 complex subunit 1A/1B
MANAPLASNIITHAWNADHSQIAIAPNSDEIWIYETKNSDDPADWVKIHTLAEHDGFVSGLDWCGATNTIVSCGHDRNAYVWDYEDGKWNPGLVILRISRAATSVHWSPDGNKFAVTSGAKCVPVCKFEEKNDFWVSNHIKKGYKSTVTCLAWCINNKFIVTGSTDFKARIHSAYMEGLDAPEDDGFGEIWPEQHKFGACLFTFNQARAWVNAVAWSPSGFRIAFTGHGGTVHVCQIGEEMATEDINTPFLPYSDIQFLSDDVIVAGGFGMNPGLYHNDGGWAFVANVDKAEQKKEQKKQGKRAAFAKFQGMSKRGTAKKQKQAFHTLHQNAITSIGLTSTASKFLTTGLDGRVQFWDLTQINDDAIQAVCATL